MAPDARTTTARRRRAVALEPGPGPGLASLESDPADWSSAAGPGWHPDRARWRSPRRRRPRGVFPGGVDPAIVERRLAAHHQFDRAAHAAHRAQQDVLGIPVHRGAAVGSATGPRGRARGPITRRRARSPSRVGVCQVVSMIRLPGRYSRAAGTVTPYGPSRKCPASRSRTEPNTLGSPPRHARPLH